MTPSPLTRGSSRRLAAALIVVACALAAGLALPAAAGRTSRPLGKAQCQPPSLKDCFTYDTMQSYATTIRPLVLRFFDLKYGAAHRHSFGYRDPVIVYYVPHGQLFVTSCGNGRANSTAYQYCGADLSVYLGQDTLYTLYSQDGDAAGAVGLAHELGHNVQHWAGVPQPRTPRQSVRFEDQADCVSGAWLRWASQQGYLEQEDVGTIQRYVRTIASAETKSRTHGDLQERAGALRRGLLYGLYGCNTYDSSTPIY